MNTAQRLVEARFGRSRGRGAAARLPRRGGFTFLRADNIVPRKAHVEIGMRDAAEFGRGEAVYGVVARRNEASGNQNAKSNTAKAARSQNPRP